MHPRGHRLVSWSYDNTVTEWDIATLSPKVQRDPGSLAPLQRRALEADAPSPVLLAYSPEGAWLAVGFTNCWIDFYTSSNLQRLGRLQPQHVTSLRSAAFSPDGSPLMALAWDGNMHVWSLETIRGQLRGFGLGWDETMVEPASPLLAAAPQPPPGWLTLLPLAGVVLAVLFGVLALRRFRLLFDSYFEADALVTRRSDELAKGASRSPWPWPHPPPDLGSSRLQRQRITSKFESAIRVPG